MRKKTMRLLSVCLLLAMILSIIPLQAFAESSELPDEPSNIPQSSESLDEVSNDVTTNDDKVNNGTTNNDEANDKVNDGTSDNDDAKDEETNPDPVNLPEGQTTNLQQNESLDKGPNDNEANDEAMSPESFTLPEGQTIILPLLEDVKGEKKHFPKEENNNKSTRGRMSLSSTNINTVYAPTGVNSYFVNGRIYLDTTTEPVAGAMLQVLAADGETILANSSGINWYNRDDDTGYYYISNGYISILQEITPGTYSMQLVAGEEKIQALTSIEFTDEPLLASVELNNFYVGSDTCEVFVRMYNSSETQLEQLTFSLLDSNDEIVGQTSGLYRELRTNNDERQISGYTLMNINGSVSRDEIYRLAITYSGGTFCNGTGGAAWSSPLPPSYKDPEITNLYVTNAQTSELTVYVDNLTADSFYILTIRDDYYGKILHQSTVSGANSPFIINLTINGLIVPISSFDTERFYVYIQQVDGYREDSKDFKNPYFGSSDVGNAEFHFEPYYINPNTTTLPFILEIYDAAGTYSGGTDFTISVKDHEGTELASISGDQTTIVREGDNYEISGILNFSSLPNETQLYIYFNTAQVSYAYVTEALESLSGYQMEDWNTKTFWLLMDQLYFKCNVINSSGTAKLVMRDESGSVISESSVVAGTPSEYYNHLNYEFILTPQLISGQKYSLALVDGEKECPIFGYWENGEYYTHYTFDGEFSFDSQNDFYLRTYGTSAGDTHFEGRIYSWECKNMTSAYLTTFLQSIVLEDEAGNINAITGYTNGHFYGGSYYFDVTLTSPLSAGNYTLTYPDGDSTYFTVHEPSIEDKTPAIYVNDAGDGYVYGAYLPTDALYTAKIYQGYTCLTNDPFVLTLSGEYNNSTQYLYIPDDIMNSLADGTYELRVYKDGVLFGSVPLTIYSKPQQTVVSAYDPFDHDIRNALISTSGYVAFKVFGERQYTELRFSEDLEELSSIQYDSFDDWAFELSPGDGEKTLYVQLRDEAGNESEIFTLTIYRLVDDVPAVYVHEDQQGVYEGENVTLVLGADTQYLSAYVDFINADGIKLATEPLEYRGLGEVTAFGGSDGTVIESDHPYSNYMDQTWQYTLEGDPSSILVTFSVDTYVEYEHDYLYVYDGSDNLIGVYTGAQLANQTLTIPGDTVKVRLISDYFETYYGFRIASVVDPLGNSGGHEDLKHIYSSTFSTTSFPNLQDTAFVRFYLGTGDEYNITTLSEVVERFLVFGSLNSIIMPQFSSLSSYRYSTNGEKIMLRGFATPNSTVTLTAEDNEGEGFSAEVQANSYGYFSYIVEDIDEGEYDITVSDDCGLSLAETSRLIIDRTPPTITSLRFKYIDNQNVAVQWTCYDTDVYEYRLFVNGVRVATITYPFGTEYNRNVLAQYGDSFMLIVIDNVGNERIETREIGDEEPPTAPGIPEMSSHGTKRISFEWDASTDNVAVVEYDIYRNNELIDTVGYETTSYTDTGLNQGTEYLYEIYARDRAGNMSESSSALLSTAVLTIKDITSFASEYIKEEHPNGISVSLTIDDSDSYYDASQSTVKLQYKLNSAQDWSEMALTGTGATKSGIWVIEDLTVGTYQVRFLVTDTEGTEKVSAVSDVAISHDMIPPVVSISTPAEGITLSGKDLLIIGDSSDNAEVDRISLYYSTDGGSTYKDITTLINEKIIGRGTFDWQYTFDASSLPSGNTIIKAVVVDGRGNDFDATVSVTLDNTPPDDVGNFSVTGTTRYIHVNWTYPPLIPGNDFAYFCVYRAESASGPFELISQLDGIGYFDDVRTIDSGVTYYYYVTAVDIYGNESQGSQILSAMLEEDNEGPTIGDMLPRNNTELIKSVPISVTSADNYRIDSMKLEYRPGGADQWTEIIVLDAEEKVNNYVFSYTWDISGLSSGIYEIRATVYDDTIKYASLGYEANAPAVWVSTVKIKAYSPPAAPVLSVASGYKSATFNWTYDGDASLLSLYELYSSTSSGGTYSLIKAVSASATSVSISVPVGTTYYYKLIAVDKCGGTAESNIVSAQSTGTDNEPPVAVISPENLLAAVGRPFAFSAVNSTDNDEIVSCLWDFGDGSPVTSLEFPTHIYTAPGSYTVSLTITDACGNSNTAQKMIDVYDITAEDSEYSLLSISVVNARVSGTPAIKGATVKVYSSESSDKDFETTVLSDINGKANIVVKNGSCEISVLAEGYIPIARNITVKPNENGVFEYTVGLTPAGMSLVDGSVTTKELTYAEILAAGIDVTDPDNNHVWKFEATFEFVAGIDLPFELPVTAYYNSAGKFIDGSGWGWISGCLNGFNIGLFPISEKLVLVVYGEAHWLKEMYKVELIVINNSYADDITDCVATLNLPDGLSLADMIGEAQSEVVNIGTIPKKADYSEDNIAKVNWYVRGDEEGEYNISVGVTGANPDPFFIEFTTDKPVKVYAGSALKLTITADDRAYRGEEYHVKFKLENVSHKDLYNLSFGLTGAEQFKAVVIGEGSAELRLNEADFADGMTQTIDVLKPGGSITIDFFTTTWFNSALELVDLGPLDVTYYLTNVFVTTLAGSTTEIPYEVVINHVPHGSFFEFLWRKMKKELEDKGFSLIDEDFFADIGLAKNAVKLYRFFTEDTSNAASHAIIKIEGGYFTPLNNFIREKSLNKLTGSKSIDAVSVFVEADEENYTISQDGKTMTLTGSANIYVTGEAAGTAAMTVTCHTWDESSQSFNEDVYTLNYTVTEDSVEAARVELDEPESDTVAVPYSGTVEVKFPYAILDEKGALLRDAENIIWSVEATDITGLSIENGVLTISNQAKAGEYTVKLEIEGGESAEKTITITREASAAQSVAVYFEDMEISQDMLLVPASGADDLIRTYTAKLLDQYGTDMSSNIIWSVTSNTSGATVNNGIVTVPAGAAKGTLILTAADSISGKSASITIIVADLTVDWDVIIQKAEGITYGDPKVSAFSALPETGTAVAGSDTFDGIFTIIDDDEILPAGSHTITVKFTVTSEGEYEGTEFTKDYTVTVKPKAITVTVDDASREYGAANPAFTVTVPDGALVGNDTVSDLNISLTSSADATSSPGIYDVTGTANNPSYTVTILGINKLTITKAELTLIGTPSFDPILANDPANDSEDALTSAVQAANTTLEASYANGPSWLTASWTLKTGTYDRKGGTYVFEAKLTPEDITNFSYNGSDPTLTVTVTPVIGTYTYAPAALIKVASEIVAADSLEDLGLPTQVSVNYDNGVPGEIYSITGWNYTLEQLQEIDVSSADVVLDLVPTVAFPDWATIDTGNLKTTLTKTNKYPVSVTVNPPAGVTYGAELGDPDASQEDLGYDLEPSPVWTYLYTGTTRAGTTYSSVNKPTQAGDYTVTATLVSETYSGSVTSTVFTITPKELTDSMLSISGIYKFTGSAITPSYTVSDGTLINDSDYTVEYTDNINVGTATITVIAASTGNYTGTVTKNFTIEKADAPIIKNVKREHPISKVSTGTIDISALLPANKGTAAYTIIGDNSGDAIASSSINENGLFSYTTTNSAAEKATTIVVKAEMQNYNDTTVEITISLVVSSSGGGAGGGGSAFPPAIPTIPAGSGVAINYTQSGETITLKMPDSKVNEIINSAEEGTAVIDASDVSDATEMEMPKAALTKFADAGLDVEINLPQGKITLDEDAVKSVAAQAGGSSVEISAKEVSHSNLTEEQKATVKSNDLVFDITVMSGTKAIHNFDGNITVTVPYNGELPVAVWYLNDNGELEEVPCVYDEEAKTVSFTTDHLSLYVIGQDTRKLPTQEWENPFVDVKPSDWFYEDVKFAFTNNYMLGTSTEPVMFSPNVTLTRGMVVTVLYRIAGSPDVSGFANPFDDVEDGKWYTDAVKWAKENGIVSGYGNGKFGPEDNIMREQLAVMIINYQAYSGRTMSGASTEREFVDENDISSWAKDAVKKLAMQGIISGKPGNLFDPKGEAIRAEFAAILHRFLEAVK